LAKGEQPAFRVSIRELLDSRKVRTADPAIKAKKAASDLQKYAAYLPPEVQADVAKIAAAMKAKQ